ncbi:hypothetical protein DV736_g2888, partial [Chaetothyriales sp. CBS 134916]
MPDADADADEPSGAKSAAPTAANEQPPAERLTELKARATAKYAVKHFRDAAELYSQATELQAEINGEMAVENADLLYVYGKCLYFLAQQTSSVLGGDAAAAQLKASKEPKAAKKRKLNGTQTNGDRPTSKSSPPATKAEEEREETATTAAPKDENDVVDEANKPADADKGKGKGKEPTVSDEQSSETQEIKTRIADIHDLQAEVSLEGEKYAAAVDDLEKCLALKQQLLPPESSLLAECHFKLSLALEFASQSQQRDSHGNPAGDIAIDWTIRDKAIAQQQAAIDSCKLRVEKETRALEKNGGQEDDEPKKEAAQAQIADVQEMIAEMEQHLADLRKPPISVKEETATKQHELAGSVLGSILGASDSEQAAVLAKAAAGASDISGLVKRKKEKLAPVSEVKSGNEKDGAKKVKIQE